MSGIIGGVVNLINIQIKSRPDGITDQICRVFLVRIMLIGTLIVGLNWYRDRVSCIVPREAAISPQFVSDACWIQGFYIFPGIPQEDPGKLAYYGIPSDIAEDGIFGNGKLCSTKVDKDCEKLSKRFYIQYQYMPFILAAFTGLFYLPYIVFKKVNDDLLRLKLFVAKGATEEVVLRFFNRQRNKKLSNRGRVVMNVIVKVLYVVCTCMVFLFANKMLYGNFKNLGTRMTSWGMMTNEEMYDYRWDREEAKPADVLLPPFGICDVREGAKDLRSKIGNKHKFICEFSQHILYQYVFVMLWYVVLIGLIASCLGFVLHVGNHLYTLIAFRLGGSKAMGVLKVITMREYQYLEFCRKKNFIMYCDIVYVLKKTRLQQPAAPEQSDKVDGSEGAPSENGVEETEPTAPPGQEDLMIYPQLPNNIPVASIQDKKQTLDTPLLDDEEETAFDG